MSLLTPLLLHAVEAVDSVALLYAATTILIALTAVFSKDSTRRSDSKGTLQILLRRKD